MAQFYPLAKLPRSDIGLHCAIRERKAASIELVPGFSSCRYPPTYILDPYGSGVGSFLKNAFYEQQAPVSLTVLPDATIFSQRFVLSQGHIHSDFQLTEKDLRAYMEGKADVSVRDHALASDAGRYGSEFLTQAPQHVRGETALLTSAEPINFGAWLIRTLPKLAYLSDVSDIHSMNFLCYCDREWQVSLLHWMGIRSAQIIPQSFHRTYRAETVLIPSWPNRSKFLDNRTKAMLQSFRIKAAAMCHRKVEARAIYVSRLNWRRSLKAVYRPFPQEEQFVAELEKLGVLAVSPEELSISEAIHLFANVDIVIGPQGAGMFNCIFCRQGTKIVEIHHSRSFLHGHPSMYASAGLDYSLVIGKIVDSGSDMMSQPVEIDLEATIAFIAEKILAI